MQLDRITVEAEQPVNRWGEPEGTPARCEFYPAAFGIGNDPDEPEEIESDPGYDVTCYDESELERIEDADIFADSEMTGSVEL